MSSSLRYLNLVRRFTTSSVLKRSYLSTDYKSKELWDQRFNCKMLSGHPDLIRTINQKIISGDTLNNVELDVFVNIAVPNEEDIAQLLESVKGIASIRKSIYANTIIPTTPHALCRLFLYSNRLSTLLLVIENRIKYGIFPDSLVFNLLLDHSIDKEDYTSATRLACHIMLQEEFCLNLISDSLALFSTLKYIESRTDFSGWPARPKGIEPSPDIQDDAILNPDHTNTAESNPEKEDQEKKSKYDEDEEQDEDEYVRVPFLRNPYFDNHFDISNPRILCGKTMTVMSEMITKNDQDLSAQINLLGKILQGNWTEALKLLDTHDSKIDKSVKSLVRFYVENTHGLEEPQESIKSNLLGKLGDAIENEEPILSKIVESSYTPRIKDAEKLDIEEFKNMLIVSSEKRHEYTKKRLEILKREELKKLIAVKKKELQDKEEYLYFFDKLKKSKLTRIEFK